MVLNSNLSIVGTVTGTTNGAGGIRVEIASSAYIITSAVCDSQDAVTPSGTSASNEIDVVLLAVTVTFALFTRTHWVLFFKLEF